MIETLREALAGERAWLVGGALRDRLLGRPTPDLDVVVDGDVRRAARSLGRGAGGGGVARGDEALLIGAGLPAEEMARRMGTINYEVTCALTARVPRAYHRDGVAL